MILILKYLYVQIGFAYKQGSFLINYEKILKHLKGEIKEYLFG